MLVTAAGTACAKLRPTEDACVREAADALLFCTVVIHDRSVLAALAALALLIDELIDAERWTPERAHRLVDEVLACGVSEARGLSFAA